MARGKLVTMWVPRRGAKTELMLAAAVAVVRGGRPVVFLCATEQAAALLRERAEAEYGEETAARIRFEAATREGKGPKAMDESRQRAFRQQVQGILHVVEARLRAEPKTSEEWEVIFKQLGEARRHAGNAMMALHEEGKGEQETRVSSLDLKADDMVLVTGEWLAAGGSPAYRDVVGCILRFAEDESTGRPRAVVNFGATTIYVYTDQLKLAPVGTRTGQVLS